MRKVTDESAASSLRVMPRCSTSAPGRDATFFHQSSGGRYKIDGPHQIADAAALVGFFDAGPEAIELGAQQFGFVEQHGGVRKQIENGAIGAGDGRVKLPAREKR